ncbi:ABC transporter ATP-binding protein [Marivivens sp. LCG002]|uniref:ABC transporter ATP-binding protein n=1 Tax=Marivivens sp. LCG002 TaxID=3051171 RepID=UPI002552E4C2|nr:ABC transporter ATP-binding protein [Marivivens sp. LCG002]WIV49625.1 ABC transporter ATP-binding protein [Marivivens sp. LCG002]
MIMTSTITSDTIVKFDCVIKKFGAFVAVEETSFDIRRGEFLAIMGSSRCGKTTMLRMLAGLEDPTEGNIYLDGERVNGKATWDRDTPMVWQSLALFPFLTVQENVEFSLKMRGVGKKERAERARTWLEKMQILEFADRNVSQLSGGQRQRVALARALVTEPKILLLDEPLSALDAHLKVRMQAVLSNLQKDLGITFVYVTHSMSEAFSMADRVIIMSRGKVEQIGTPQEIYHKPKNTFVAEFLGSANIFNGRLSDIAGNNWTVDTDYGSYIVHPEGDDAKKTGDALSFIVSAENIRIGDASSSTGGIIARAIGEEFVGASATVYFETANGQEIKVQKSHHELAALNFATGKDYALTWDSAACYVLPQS